MGELVLPNESYAIMGACFEVYKQMGCGFLESVYQECLAMEFRDRGIPFVEQPHLRLRYKDQELTRWFEPDFLCYDQVVIELKAVSNLVDEHRSQTLNYLHATHYPLGLLINFGHHPKLEYERIALTHPRT